MCDDSGRSRVPSTRTYGPVVGVRTFVVVAAVTITAVGVAATTECATGPPLRCLRFTTAPESLALFFAPKGRPLLRFVGDCCCRVVAEAAEVALAIAVAATAAVVVAVPLTLPAPLTDTRSGSDTLTSGSVFTLCAGDCSVGIAVRGTGDAFIPSGTPATLRRLSLPPPSMAPEPDGTADGPGPPTLEGRLHSVLSKLRRRFIGSSLGGDPPLGPALA